MAAPAAVDKTLLAFLNGIAKRVYFKDDSISDELLRTEVLGGISETGSLLILLIQLRHVPWEQNSTRS